MAYDAQPRFNPDGKKRVFISDRDGADNVHPLDRATSDRWKSASWPTCSSSQKDALADLRNTNTLRYVMKNGRLYDGNMLAEEYPTRRAGPEVENRPTLPVTNAGTRK